MEDNLGLRFVIVDRQLIELIGRLPAQKRHRAMLDVRELAVGLMRGRLRRSFPEISEVELNFKVLEVTTRAHKAPT